MHVLTIGTQTGVSLSQVITMRAVNPTPRPTFIPLFDKSQCDKRFVVWNIGVRKQVNMG